MSRLKDLTGEKFGRLTVIKRAESRGRNTYWLCSCECGCEKEVRSSHLGKSTLSCGCLAKDKASSRGMNLEGLKFGKLTVIEKGEKDNLGRFRWLCSCECGNNTLCYSTNLKSGLRVSCGCSAREKTIKRNKDNSLPNYSKHKNSQGYVLVKVPDHPNSFKRGWVLEHVYVMSEHLGRPLVKGENVHHKNGIRHDNRIENLELWASSQPSGQRVEDVITFCKDYLQQYAPHLLAK